MLSAPIPHGPKELMARSRRTTSTSGGTTTQQLAGVQRRAPLTGSEDHVLAASMKGRATNER